MPYYKTAVLGSNLKPLLYFSQKKIPDFSIVKIPLGKQSVKNAVILGICDEPNFQNGKKFEIKEILEITNLYFTPYQANLAEFIAYYYVCEIGMVFDIFTPCEKIEQNLQICKFENLPNLTDKQQKAYEFADKNETSLIFGDTGSGKSEIYINLIAKMLEQGKQSLFLMPEIALTPQMEKRLKSYFGENIALWHSKITPKKKSEILEKFTKGEIKLIAGARSALFLPFTNSGLIVVDEEHDDSYKSNQKPRYNARDLAIFIGKKLGMKVVLGSATPSLTTYAKQPNFRLKGTFFQSEKKFIYDICETALSDTILSQISKSLNANRQVIVFLPTRANYKYIICQNCKTIQKCPFCAVAMSYHEKSNSLKCHYCGFSNFYKIPCAKCGGNLMEARKIGTSEIVKQLENKFPNAKIAKFDRDEITTQKKLENLLKDFNDAKIDILVGTQMLSKGHDYHNVDLAVIMGIDEHLSYADFRAREKTLALVMQVAGRAGRAGRGRVVVQTEQSEFFKTYIENYDEFLSDESTMREPLYPPFARLLRILISHKNDGTAKDTTEKAVQILKTAPNVEIIGHGKAGIEYIASKYRYEILLRSNSPKALINAANLVRDLPNLEIDMDPINFS
ncbi:MULTISPECIES: primosomal protein N' [unclassified Campylobacter]|uniref:primosomal protein N' n=1 Tax=unclassified Campylobacter TaxID=2593542 RepID=UPI0022EA0318|nr:MULTISPECIES: primosomal protein N' [unclassified Campylobacter]MDA3079758.1 primosomal protein N' [Campylobacter sp. CS_NA2]MDA3081482.1 primosomal protein N' [Campylobacter sp. CS_NA1]MDA3085855.1 primosomal protein N' [Campylobacter sp. CS_ED1]MDA3090590.1 primosomal protein N' [Campylobacter sp. CS_ED2]WBR50629.1 primosomal protein N' [Campylobacter sp. CS_NA3]